MAETLPRNPQAVHETPPRPNALLQSRSFTYIGVLGALTIAFFFLGIRLILGHDSFITIHDNLDSEVPWRFAMAVSPDPHTIKQIMNGLPGSFLPSRLNLIYLFFELFEPFTAYILIEALVHGIAFLSMFLLLHWHFRHYLSQSRLLIAGIALCFSFLPFYNIYGLSIAGQPLLLACFLNLQSRQRVPFSLLYIAIFCFASSFVLAGLFIIISTGLWFLWHTFRSRKINYYFLAGLVLLVICYSISEYKLLKLILLKEESSHREAWDLVQMSKPLAKAFYSTGLIFVIGQYHVASQHILILALSALASIVAWQRRLYSFLNPLLRLWGCLAIIALIYGFFYWSALIPLKQNITLLKTLNLSRFYFLQPLLWHLVLVFALGTLYFRFRSRKMAVALLGLQLCFTVGSNLQVENELRTNLHLLAGTFTGQNPAVITYEKYVSEELFEAIDSTIGKPQASYRIVCLGFYPGIAQLNGFYTLDSYQNNYPLRYKNAFRQVIAPELAQNPKWQAYFDGWGSRCYLFPSETQQTFPDNAAVTTLQHFRLNNQALKQLGGQYLISAYFLQNSPANNLKLIHRFEHPEALRPLYLYAIQ